MSDKTNEEIIAAAEEHRKNSPVLNASDAPRLSEKWASDAQTMTPEMAERALKK